MLRVCGRQQYLPLAGVGKPTGEEIRREKSRSVRDRSSLECQVHVHVETTSTY